MTTDAQNKEFVEEEKKNTSGFLLKKNNFPPPYPTGSISVFLKSPPGLC